MDSSDNGFHSGAECFVDSANNIAVSGGALTLTARREPAPFACTQPRGQYTTQYTSGEVTTWQRFSQTYGRFEVRAKLPAATVKGLQESFWLWPVNATKYGTSWPSSGEIDIAEIYHQYPDRAIPYIHYVYEPATVDPTTDTNIVANAKCLIKNISAYHSYAVEWTASSIKIVYDGATCVEDHWSASGLNHPAPFDQPFLLALTQALGIGGNAFDPATTPLPATTSIDYVRVWRAERP